MPLDSSRRDLLPQAFREFPLAERIFSLVLIGLLTCLTCTPCVSASDLVGKARNGTTHKPSSGDEVVLLSLSKDGTKEIARTRTDSTGHFRFTVDKQEAVDFVRVNHQGVTYDVPVESLRNPVVVQVYDAVDKLDGVEAVMDVQRFEATNDTLEIKQLVTLRNSSKPPRTLLAERSLEIQLPPQAQIASGLVQIEEQQPVKDKPAPGEQKGTYYFRQPLRPGDTRFAVVYRLSYNGKALIEPKIRNPNERFVVMLPKSMRFEPRVAGAFASTADVSSDNVQGTAPVTSDQTLAFTVSGTGMLQELQGKRTPQSSTAEHTLLSSELMNLVSPQGPQLKSYDVAIPTHKGDSFTLVLLTAVFAAAIAYICITRRRAATALTVRQQALPMRGHRRENKGSKRDRSKRYARAHQNCGRDSTNPFRRGNSFQERQALLVVLSLPVLWNQVFDGLQSNLSSTRFDGDRQLCMRSEAVCVTPNLNAVHQRNGPPRSCSGVTSGVTSFCNSGHEEAHPGDL